MQRRGLGNTPVEISAIGLRAATDAGLMRAAFDRGITYFDAADSRALSELVQAVGRSRIQIAEGFGHGFSPRAVRASLEALLRRLATDYLDLYCPRELKLPECGDELFAELEKLRLEGKIRAWGVSLGPGPGWREEGIAAMLERGTKVVQAVYSIFEQDPGREFCQVARSARASVLAAPDDSGATPAKLSKLRPYAQARGLTPEQLALRWLLMDPAVASVILTPTREADLAAAITAASAPPLSLDEMTRIAEDYANDWGLGPDAHPRDLGSSTSPTGKVRSGYVPPPVLLA